MKTDPVTGLKTCNKCRTPQSPVNFYHDRAQVDGLCSQCKKCHSSRPKNLEWYRSYRRRNREHVMFGKTRYRAKMRDILFTITEDDIYIPDKCPVESCERLLVMKNDGKTGSSPASPSIDRYDPSLGYIPGNVWVICNECNTRKRDMSGEELVSFGLQLIDAFKEECERVAQL